MDEKKNIDRLFQEKFKDYEVFPNPAVWENIEGSLMKKKNRRIIPLWIRIGGAAAILLLLISTGFWFYNQDTDTLDQPSEKIIITNTDKSNKVIEENALDERIITDIGSKDEIKDTKSSNKENGIVTTHKENNIAKTSFKTDKFRNRTTKNNSVVDNSFYKEKDVKTASPEEVAISKDQKNLLLSDKELNQATVNKVDVISKEELTSEKLLIAQEETVNEQKSPQVDIQQEIEKTNSIEKTILKDKWSIGSTIAPVYYNTLGKGSPIDPALANNTKNSDDSFSYGVKVNYKLSKKLSLQSGINTLELGYTTENVTALISSSLLDVSNTNINTNIDGLSVIALSTVSQNSDAALNQRSSFDVSGSLDQSLNYVEIPLELKYNILQKKLGVHVIGGFSTYFLYQNSVSVTSFGKTTTLGEASNINSLNFSGNLGIDFDYNITKKLYINVSPMFKYQFNTFSKNSGGFQPYYLGIYTGLNFRF